MNRPEPDPTAYEEDLSIVPADPWGEKEEIRQIALLDAVVRMDDIHRIIDTIAASEEGDEVETTSFDFIPVSVDEELRQSYLDYAMCVIMGGALDPNEAVRKLRVLSHRVMTISPHPGELANLQKQGLTVALAIFRLKRAAWFKRISALLLKLLKTANTAYFRRPLFAYGPELSEFRHRLR
ncbi:hypothetical protein ACVWZ9_001940 [Pseudomonas chlororaphis]